MRRANAESNCYLRWLYVNILKKLLNCIVNYLFPTENPSSVSISIRLFSIQNFTLDYPCYRQFSVIQGTIFEKSRIPLTKWFIAIYFFTTKKRGISSYQLAKWLGIKQHSAWFMLHRLREAMKEENNILLSGVVEADETSVMPKIPRDLRLLAAKERHKKEQNRIHGLSDKQRRKHGFQKKRGRKKGSTKEVLEQEKIERGGTPYYSKKPSERIPFERGAIIFGMIEQRGRIVMKVIGRDIRCITKANLIPLLKKHITANSIVFTDQLNKYNSVGKHFASHSTINHKLDFVKDGVHTNNIENAWKHLKKMIDSTYFHLSYHHFDGYLNENTYRWNRKDETEKVLFEDFFSLVIDNKITYKELKSKKKNKLAA